MSDIGPQGGSFDIPPPADLLTPPILPAKNIVIPPPTYKLLNIQELFEMSSPKWTVKGVIRKGEIGALFGIPGCYKTFVAVDLSMHIVTGIEWWGHRVLKGPVVYLAGEGVRGLKRRVQAWAAKHGVEDPTELDLRILPHSIRFLEAAEFQRLLETLRQLSDQPVLIVIDTLARYFNGEENSAKEIGQFIELATKLRDLTGAAILLVHHEGKDQKGLRGSSALHGALDVTIKVKRDNDLVTLQGDKSKDDVPLAEHFFRTKYIWLGTDEDGDTVGSLVLERAEPPEVVQPGASPASESETEPEPEKPDHGATIRKALATLFAGRATGPSLLKASGLKDSTFYDALTVEIEAKRIRTEGGRYPTYVLTDTAPEYVSPSPTPSPEDNLDSESGGPSESERRESESETDTLSLKRVSEGSESESRSDVAQTRPQQKKKKRSAAPKRKPAKHQKPQQAAPNAVAAPPPSAASPGVPPSAASSGGPA